MALELIPSGTGNEQSSTAISCTQGENHQVQLVMVLCLQFGHCAVLYSYIILLITGMIGLLRVFCTIDHFSD